ncbi:DUF3793 family protein [Clostridium sp. CCUG 7971]|uniref:DUF3793 family protein n=1 Tax=Clostridium sp. CCUG 7971 TaxID=2811414 RepID=UPI001ABAC6FD|nr:DUF3793 family protein [Clostridium sp. CCUG 7971]
MNNNCVKNCCKNNTNSDYIKWILEVLGPVILGSKPCEILNIPLKDKMRVNKLNDIENFFSNCFKVNYEVISTTDGGTRILFINKKSLSKVLDNKKYINFLKFIGYPSNYSIDNYIDVLVDKLHSKEFPHEIGIFLGYPLKDVAGFMGYGNYKFCKVRYWKVYGDPSISDMVCDSFIKDRNKMKEILEFNSLDELKKVI